jgi:hypothetical protein
VQFGPLNEPLQVELGRDVNGNGSLSQSEIEVTQIVPVGSNSVVQDNLASGTYFVILRPTIQDDGTNYNFVMTSSPIDNAGNTLILAREVLLLGPPANFVDNVGRGIGNAPNDFDDFYRFVPGANGPYTFIAQLGNLSGDATLQLIN